MSYSKKIQSILGVDVRARSSNKINKDFDYTPFKNPIIHKRIDGLEIAPIDSKKLWGK
ncbi:hypothetical protein [Cytobacillus purgationiresistens]|uniref:Uncharacterized protein n=1 Tax=Cytobacillus purgationiresistens TaxID=863449 RepID=A0ABU0ABL0_9BACI|nr:hypothetical protein [Cytobacillus purgationiresistens]MDQ0268643.1 hypothetical protein [Cytobacillus purgationiresistens]